MAEFKAVRASWLEDNTRNRQYVNKLKRKGNQHCKNNNVMDADPQQGNSKAYTLGRLERESPFHPSQAGRYNATGIN